MNWNLKNIKYILDLKKMLILVGKLDDEGYHVIFGNPQWNVRNGNMTVSKGYKRDTPYMVEVSEDKANIVEVGHSLYDTNNLDI